MELPVEAVPAVVLVGAVVLDSWMGEPPTPLHPVVWIGHAARPLLALRRRGLSPAPAFLAGLTWTLMLAGGVALGVARLLDSLAAMPWVSLAVQVFLTSSLFALRALLAAGTRLAVALEAGDLPGARAAVGHLCSRDPSALEAPALASAGIESVAENAHDSVVAPLLFYALGGLPALAFYRVVNTLDAMVGYRDDREYLGKAAARLDDLLNLLPARLSAGLLALSALSPQTVWQPTVRRDAATPEGPNSGWPMAVAAATLEVRLEKTGSYILGASRPPPGAPALRRVMRDVRRASLAWMACVVAFLAWHGGPLVRLWHP